MLTRWRQKLSLVNVHFNSRRTCIWSLSISPIFAEVRLKEFWMLQTAKWPFFNILAFLSVLMVILVNMCWPNVIQINFMWKCTSKGSERLCRPAEARFFIFPRARRYFSYAPRRNPRRFHISECRSQDRVSTGLASKSPYPPYSWKNKILNVNFVKLEDIQRTF